MGTTREERETEVVQSRAHVLAADDSEGGQEEGIHMERGDQRVVLRGRNH